MAACFAGTLIVEDARIFCSSKICQRTTLRLKAQRGSEQYQPAWNRSLQRLTPGRGPIDSEVTNEQQVSSLLR